MAKTWATKTWTCPVCGTFISYPDLGTLRTFVHEEDGSHGPAMLNALVPEAVWLDLLGDMTAPNPYSSIFARPREPIAPPTVAQRIRVRVVRYRSRVSDAWRVLRGEAFVSEDYDY